MRRVLPVAILCGLLAAAPAAVAQRGGAGHSAAHAGGFSGGFRGGFSAPRSFGGFSGARFPGFAQRGLSMAPRMIWTVPRSSAAPGYYSASRPAYGADRRGSNRGGRYPYRPPYRGASSYAVYAYPSYANSWELLPWDLGYPDFTGYGDDSAAYQPSDQPEPQPQPQYVPQPEYVAPPDQGYAQDYPPPYPMAAPAAPPTAIASQPQLTLIFEDGHTQTIRNYMLTSSAVIVMDQAASGREMRIPLSQLNLAATEQAARQDGLDFSPPAS